MIEFIYAVLNKFCGDRWKKKKIYRFRTMTFSSVRYYFLFVALTDGLAGFQDVRRCGGQVKGQHVHGLICSAANSSPAVSLATAPSKGQSKWTQAGAQSHMLVGGALTSTTSLPLSLQQKNKINKIKLCVFQFWKHH